MVNLVNRAMCDHAELVIPALLALLVLTIGIVGRYLNEKLRMITDLQTQLLEARSEHDECQKALPEKYATRDDVALILAKIDKIADIINNFHLVYRTKAEAHAEWKMLENRLTSIENNIGALSDSNKERHREIWDKLNRVVDFFKDEREKLEKKLNGLDSKKNNG